MKLIPLDALVAEINQRIKDYKSHKIDDSYHDGLIFALEDLRDDFLDTLEVKEVDLDFQRFAKEMDAIFALPSSETKNTEEEPLNWEYAVAKHFFELGLNASNPLTWEDTRLIAEIGDKFMNSEESDNLSEEEYYTEILNRFKAQKGE